MFNAIHRLRLPGTLIAAVAVATVGMSPAQAAGSSTGTIAVSLNVTAACAVNGATSIAANLGQVGALAFADQPGLFGNTDASMVATGGGSGLSILCSPGSSPTLTVGSGANDAGGLHYMASGANKLAYHLYSDSGRTNEIGIGQAISLGTATSTAFNVPIYGRVSSNGAVLAAGAYTDTVQVTVAW
ncbi:Csu type fimbrial protein [Sphingomonas oryzagri]|jgi:spore coat protein U-like protein|uniref:Spore coat U domain-containing protein n=1 Tax=Sphingomonas oryzagri TaxID=3042314 RepID=A0ABT6N3M9_9SPHN|nr:spore coat U domain-containing protein [Sphingomonas oryzagri]MDH7639777.1 spore coat U domain-containing protein [Sphingomonas oryzagri]